MLLSSYLFNNNHVLGNNPIYMPQTIYKNRCILKYLVPLRERKKSQNITLRSYTTKNTDAVYLAQIVMNSSCQTNKGSDIKNFDSPSSNSLQNIVAKRNNQYFIDMHLHFKSILQVLYLLCNVLQNQGTIYVVGYKPEILVSTSLLKKKSFKKSASATLPEKKNNKKLKITNKEKAAVRAEKVKSFWENQYSQIDLGIASIHNFPNLQAGEENWCASSLSNWREKSNGFWRTARFLKQLQDFAVQNGHDFYQLRKKHSSLVSQLITVKKQSSTAEDIEHDFYMPFFCKPDLLLLFDAESKRSVLKQAKSLQIPTVVICDSKEIANEALYSLSGNHKSIHLLYRLLDSFSFLSNRT